MFPQPNNLPACISQSSKVPLISFPISLQFGTPEFRQFVLPCGKTPAVPKVSVNEDSQFLLAEHDVWRTVEILVIPLEAIASALQFMLNNQFQRAVFDFHGFHRPRALFGCQMVRHCESRAARRGHFAPASMPFTLSLMFSRTVESFFLAASVRSAVCATASRIGLYSFASRARLAFC